MVAEVKLEPGDKFWVTRRDGADTPGWAEWNGRCFLAPCGLRYWKADILCELRSVQVELKMDGCVPTHYLERWVFIAEQLIAEGSI